MAKSLPYRKYVWVYVYPCNPIINTACNQGGCAILKHGQCSKTFHKEFAADSDAGKLQIVPAEFAKLKKLPIIRKATEWEAKSWYASHGGIPTASRKSGKSMTQLKSLGKRLDSQSDGKEENEHGHQYQDQGHSEESGEEV